MSEKRSEKKTDGSVEVEARRSPMVTQAVLLVLFLAITVIGVFTVLIPELEDDGSPEAEETEEAASAETPSDSAPPSP